jgi:pimeloyl-ACP methyl ester carboxylesterase
MPAVYAVFLACSLHQARVEVRIEQVYPLWTKGTMVRSQGQARAVVLIPGLKIHPLKDGQAARAEFHDWQRAGSPLVQALGKNADVFALAYCQNVDLETISQSPGIDNAVQKLRFLGYREITLVGHSAGGVLARLFVEDHPYAPVTKVVQICAPNLGSSWAKAEIGFHKVQGPFLQSLSKSWRQNICWKRSNRLIPQRVQFLCVMGTMGTLGDGLVSCRSQWPEDLQRQGIPVVRVPTTHLVVMHSKKTAAYLADLIQRDHPRWPAAQISAARMSYLRKASAP